MNRGKFLLIIAVIMVLLSINVAQARTLPAANDAPEKTKTPPGQVITPGPKKKEEADPVYLVSESFLLERITSLEISGFEGRALTAADPLLDAIDAALPNVWQQLVILQQDYYQQSGGHYIQGLKSHSQNPANGANEYPDLFLNSPSDFPVSWLDTGLLPYSPSPYAYELNTYRGPFGSGFVFCLYVDVSGQTWQRCLNYGGEIWRSKEWTSGE